YQVAFAEKERPQNIISIEEYIRILESAPGLVNSPEGIEKLDRFITGTHHIKQDGKWDIIINLNYLSGHLNELKKGQDGAEEKLIYQLKLIAEQARSIEKIGKYKELTPGIVKSNLSAILSDKAFSSREIPTIIEMLTRFSKWYDSKIDELAMKMDFLDILKPIFKKIDKLWNLFTRSVSWTLSGLLLAWLLFLLLIFIRLKRREVIASSGMAKQTGRPEKFLREARIMAGKYNYREAIRLLFISLLLAMDKKEIIEYDSYLTNREILKNISPDAVYLGTLIKFSELFDRIWYGMETAGAVDFEEGEALYREVISRC
ncbi:MAG: hypothetical protein J7M18_04760, partial [Candidatus Eremiobacteraeota bacterium]|nr:hypothetical protein [Candidatus Eremiobacteraeota bacterium]